MHMYRHETGDRQAVAIPVEKRCLHERSARLARKQSGLAANRPPDLGKLRRRFEARLGSDALADAERLLRALSRHVSPPLRYPDLAPVADLQAATLAEWERRIRLLWRAEAADPASFASARAAMEQALAQRFVATVSQRRQTALGISHYVWRSRDDDKVRAAHARYDDKVFSWDDPPEGGHPGEAFNCRCRAEPLLPEDLGAQPETGPAYRLGLYLAEAGGIADAVGDFADETVATVLAAPAALQEAAGFGMLLVGEARGTLTPRERAELARIRRQIEVGIDALAEAFADAPELAGALLAHVREVRRAPERLGAAYRQGLATEEEVREAHRARGYLETLIVLNVAPGVGTAALLRRLGWVGEAGDTAGIARALGRATARLRRRRDPMRAETIDNPGIAWARGIVAQGEPWEAALDASGRLGRRTAPTFKTFDFFDDETKTATSAKTLDTGAPTYRDRPGRIHGQLRRYLDQIATFDWDKKTDFKLTSEMIARRRLELAVPATADQGQRLQIQRAVAYAESLGIEMKVSFVK